MEVGGEGDDPHRRRRIVTLLVVSDEWYHLRIARPISEKRFIWLSANLKVMQLLPCFHLTGGSTGGGGGRDSTMPKGGSSSVGGVLKYGSILVAVLVAIAASVPAVVELAFRRQYPVHVSGGVLVTGASTGIGRHAAVTLAEKGYVVFAGVRKEKDSESIKALGITNLRPVILDVTVQENIDSAYDSIVSTLEQEGLPFVGLVNNAGVGGRSPFEFHEEEVMRRMFEVNYFGMVKVTKKFLSLIRKSQGRIINMSSVAGRFSGFLESTYTATKHAVEALTDGLRLELSIFNISVSAVEPGIVQSEILEKVRDFDPVVLQTYERFVPLIPLWDRWAATASPPTVTSDAILHALSDRYPKTRYLVAGVEGVPASVLTPLCEIADDRLKDAVTLDFVPAMDRFLGR